MSNLGRLLRTESAMPAPAEATIGEALRCGCIEGAMTGGEHHEQWCPEVTGTYGTLPVLDLAELGVYGSPRTR